MKKWNFEDLNYQLTFYTLVSTDWFKINLQLINRQLKHLVNVVEAEVYTIYSKLEENQYEARYNEYGHHNMYNIWFRLTRQEKPKISSATQWKDLVLVEMMNIQMTLRVQSKSANHSI